MARLPARSLEPSVAIGAAPVPLVGALCSATRNARREVVRPRRHRTVNSSMLRCRDDLKILGAIVCLDVVDVVDVFVGRQQATDGLFNHNAMFGSVATVFHFDIPVVPAEKTPPLPAPILLPGPPLPGTRDRTKTRQALIDLLAWCNKRRSARLTETLLRTPRPTVIGGAADVCLGYTRLRTETARAALRPRGGDVDCDSATLTVGDSIGNGSSRIVGASSTAELTLPLVDRCLRSEKRAAALLAGSRGGTLVGHQDHLLVSGPGRSNGAGPLHVNFTIVRPSSRSNSATGGRYV